MRLFMSFIDHWVEEERFVELEQLGIGREILDELEDLSATARVNLVKSNRRCFDFMIYRETLLQMIADAKSSARSKKALSQCIARGAPYEMMHQLYGISLRCFRKHRRRNNVTKEGVRVTDDPRIVTAIENAWEARGRKFDPDIMLEIDDETNANMKVIWFVLGRYAPPADERPTSLLEHFEPIEQPSHV